MKRCPQCEFIYEDDQNQCDMDGVMLVYDSRALPNLHALATVPAALPLTVKRRNRRLVPAFATVILTLLAASVYYVSSQRAASNAPTGVTPAQAPAAVMRAEPVTPPAPAEKRETQPPPSTKPAAAPAKKETPKAETKTSTTTAKPTAAKPEHRKKETSKVASILKKTGRILKKPFQF